MRRRLLRTGGAGGAVAWLAVALAGCGGGGGGGGGEHPGAVGPPRTVAVPRHAAHLILGSAGRRVPRGYLGLSLEFQAIRDYTGTDPDHVDPVLENLLRGLSPGQPPVLRIGGDSTDAAWVPAPGLRPPVGYNYPLTSGWLATSAALARDLHARMLLGLDLAAEEPELDAVEARAFTRAFGPRLAGLELGNEPNLYSTITAVRPTDYGPAAWRAELNATLRVLPAGDRRVPLLGPALSAGPDPQDAEPWTSAMGRLLTAEPRIRQLTIHRYPLKNCYTAAASRQYPSIAHLLSSYASVTLAAGVRRWARIAHRHGRTLRIDELNSVACRGKPGVSDTFASALWATDALFSLLDAGVDAVNLHTLPRTAYELFSPVERGGHWRAAVHPVYYGALLFARAAPAGARLVAVSGARQLRRLSVWATRAPDATTRLVLVDRDPDRPVTVTVRPPAGARGAVSVQRLTASGLRATGGVRLGGQTFGAHTSSGTLGAPRLQPPGRTRGGENVVTVSGASAALVTFAAG